MKQQLLKPWVVVALVFLLVSGILTRVVEYQLPVAAHRLYTEVEDRCDAFGQLNNQQTIPDSENAIPVYEEAIQAMMTAQSKYTKEDGYFMEWVLEDNPENYHVWELQQKYVLPLPSQPLPEGVYENLHQCIEAYQPVLDLLHRAADLTLPDKRWGDYRLNERVRPHGLDIAFYSIDKILPLEALVCILDNNESGAMRALQAHKALNSALSNHIVLGFQRGIRSIRIPDDRFWVLLYFGMERNLFSADSLIELQATFGFSPEATHEFFARYMLMRQENIAYWLKNEPRRFSPFLIGPLFGDFSSARSWYTNRLALLGATATFAGATAKQHYLLGEASETITKLMKRHSDEWANVYNWLVEDPFGRFPPFGMSYTYDVSWYERHCRYYEWKMRFLRVVIALDRYRQEHGAFPENINELTGYVSISDLADFTCGIYRYDRTDNGWLISSSNRKGDRYNPVYGYPLGTVKRNGGSYF